MSTLGPRTALKSRKISGSLAYILAQTNVKQGTKALPNDVAGCTLEMGADGLWTGASVGTLTQVQADALVASGALASVKVGTPGTVEGSLMHWDGSAWVVVGGASTGFSTSGMMSANAYVDAVNVGGNIVDNKYILNTDGSFVASSLYFVSKIVPVIPGKSFVLYLATTAITNMGCYYLDGVFVSDVSTSFANGVYVVPAGCNQVRFTVEKAVPVAQRFCYFNSEPLEISSTVRRLTANGDSITASLLTDEGYVSILSRRINASATTNLGVPASTYTSPGYTPLYTRNAKIPSDTDVLVLFAGTNDYGLFTGGAPLGEIGDAVTNTFYGAVNTCIEYALKTVPQAKIVICTPTRRGTDATANGQGLLLSDYCAAIIASAKKYGIRVADLYNDAGINSAYEQQARMYYNTDKLHPSRNGHARIADVIYRALL